MVASALRGAEMATARFIGAALAASDTVKLSRCADREGDVQQSRAYELAYALTARSQS